MENISSDALPVPLFKRKKGLRRLRMSFNYENQLVVSMPWHCSESKARQFVEEQKEWIHSQKKQLAPVLTLADYLVQYPTLSLNGRAVTISIHQVGSGGNHWIYDDVRAEGLFQVQKAISGSKSLETLFRSLASTSLKKRTAFLAERSQLFPNQVAVRDQKSRWGSCSQTGAISLNWRLLLCSPGAQDYVILHELAHLRHLNHSADFHRLLTELDPNRSEHEKELDKHGSRWMRVGRIS